MSSNRERIFVTGPGRRMINRIYTVLTTLGLGASYRHLLTVAGRRTGLPRTTPVDVMSLDDTAYLVAPYGVVSWVHNVRAAGVVELSRTRRTRRYRATELAPADATSVIRSYIARVPVTRTWWAVRSDASDDELRVEAATHPVFRLDPASDDSGTPPHPVRAKEG